MRRSPSIVPEAVDQEIYLVLDDFGALGRSWRETDEAAIDRETVIIRCAPFGNINGPATDASIFWT